MDKIQQPVRRVERTLTQKYNMHSLRQLQALEIELMKKLAVVYGIDDPVVSLTPSAN